MNKGVEFALKNCEKTLKLVNEVEKYKNLKPKVIREFHYLKSIKHTGNMYEHYLKYKDGSHKYAKDFDFLDSYGIISNEKMADYLKENYFDELNDFCTINDFIIGNIYSNNEIASAFKCSIMGGMRRSITTNSLVLIANHINLLYDDQWTEDGILNYTGMGAIGDQSISFGQNKTLSTAKQNHIKVYLFESYKKNEYYFCGEVELCGKIFTAKELDDRGFLRNVLKFPLRQINRDNKTIINIEDIKNREKSKARAIKKLSHDEIKEKAKNIESSVIAREVKTVYRERNPFVAEYTKNRAKGICDLCGKPAPFCDKSDNPYLESHHIITLADGGPDAIYNTVAICPNCHRRIHILNNKKDREKLKKTLLKYLQDDKDEKNITKYNILFKD